MKSIWHCPFCDITKGQTKEEAIAACDCPDAMEEKKTWAIERRMEEIMETIRIFPRR